MMNLNFNNLKPKSRTIVLTSAIASLLLITSCSQSSNSSNNNNQQAVTTNTPTTQSTVTPDTDSTPAASAENDPIAATIAGMTLEEKIGQMLLVGVNGTSLEAQDKKMIAEDKVGGIILYKANIKDLNSMVSFINSLKESNSGNLAPLFMSVDQEGGKVSRLPKEYATFPSNKKVGNHNDSEAAEQMGRLLAKAVMSAGFNMNFAPVLDINSNPNNPVIGDRSFGNSAELVSKLGIAEMKGIESGGVIPVVKHFPGHGDTSVDSHLNLPIVNKTTDELADLEWLPFEAAIKANTDAVMIAHILYPKLDPDKPASLSSKIIGELLREKMGYNGLVITDDLTMGAIMKNYDLANAAVDTVNAGSDILLVAFGQDNAKKVINSLLDNVKNGKIEESRIDESVHRILALKAKYNLSDEPVPVPNLTDLNNDIKSWRSTIEK